MALAPTTGPAGTPAQPGEVLLRMRGVGADEVQPISIGSDLPQVEQVAALVAALGAE